MQQQDMSESSSGLTTSNQKFHKTYSSCCSILSDTHTIPPVLLQNRGFIRQNCDFGQLSPHLPACGCVHSSAVTGGDQSELPSDPFKYLSWQDIEEHDVRGNQLHCPRVRDGPSEEELFFRGEEHYLKKRKQVTDTEKWQKKQQENWENCAELNLSFQDLGDLYQVENFKRVLRRLIRVEKLWLVDNSLTDLSAIRLPRCRELNVNKNHFTSFKQLPKMPQIQHLSLAENNIMTLSGISDFRQTPLESLILKRNPCEFQERYRQLVFSSLPNLKMLDGIPKLPEDCSPPDIRFFYKMCTIL
ncbi:PREDICTED: uncharacterized protein LOC106886135 isoform X2 [Calidris pugnax]|uniref:uncharacterized protein LOC106886135 isoform X2 n=1 Tax=Calidris pugnax TaxID=198806 RepID=UPI00071CB2B2|nr:PREDICTED: uncharacterized protein LOC106886135 isoform X2 [Calidris pugnax]